MDGQATQAYPTRVTHRVIASLTYCSSEASFSPFQSGRLSRYDASSRAMGQA